MAALTPWAKARTLVSTIENWPLVVIDKAGVKSSVTYRTRSGLSFVCRSKSTDINEVTVVASGWEYDADFCRLRGDSPVVFDLGANIGAFAVYVDRLNPDVDYVGHAFEPYRPNFDLLTENRQLNRVSRFELHEMAIAGAGGEVVLDDSGSADGVKIGGTQGPTAKCVRLDTFCNERGITKIELLKMDVEGAEYEIFDTTYDFIQRNVDRLVVEYHLEEGGPDRSIELERLLNQHFDVSRRHQLPTNGLFYCVRR